MDSISSAGSAIAGADVSASAGGGGTSASAGATSTTTTTNADGSITTILTGPTGAVLSISTSGGKEQKGPGSTGSAGLLDVSA